MTLNSAVKKDKKHIFARYTAALLLSLLMMFTVSINAMADAAGSSAAPAAVPAPSESFYVYDEADVLSEETENAILQKNGSMNTQYGSALVVMTVNTINGSDLEQFTQDVFETWKVGGDTAAGVLLVLDIQEDNYFAVSGVGFGTEFSSNNLKALLDANLEADFAAKDYNAAVTKFFTALSSDAETYLAAQATPAPSADSSASPENSETSAASEAEASPEASPDNADTKDSGGMGILGGFLTFLVILAVLAVVLIVLVYIRGQMIKKKRRQQRAARRNSERRSSSSRSAPVSRTPKRPTDRPRTSTGRTDESYRDFMDRYK